MQVDRGYTDPRLASLYDMENAGRDDIEFYLGLAAELDAETVADVGCGTGVLATDLAARGHEVTGVDPARAMLDVARSRRGGGRVTWIEGTAADLGTAAADLVVMTGHVAQIFVEDADWHQLVGELHRGLKPGGHVAFESRNPGAEGWTSWTREKSRRALQRGDGEFVTTWVEVTGVRRGVVDFLSHTVFSASGEHVQQTSTLRFRTRVELEASLIAAGLQIHAVYGDWDRTPVTTTSPELIVLARRPAQP
jgi:ubiquinone/menaquinone biosynthesis C-methylase UbiE